MVFNMAAVFYSTIRRIGGIHCRHTPKCAYRNVIRNASLSVLNLDECHRTPNNPIHRTSFLRRYSSDTKPDRVQIDDKTTIPEAATNGPSDELLQSLNAEDQRTLKVRWMELEVFYQSGLPVPKQMTDDEWKEAMEKASRAQRLKYYRFLCIRNERRERTKLKKRERREAYEKVKEERRRDSDQTSSDLMEYGLGKNAILLRVYESTMNLMYNHWQIQAIRFGQPIVVDMGYDEHMVKKDCSNCAEQIRDLYGHNKMNREPFHLHLCNVNPSGWTHQYLERFIPNLYENSCMITVTQKSYLDVFPREKIVYLSPHSPTDLKEYDHEAVYVIGGIVDKSDPSPISLAKSKKEGIRTARLPLNHYLDWGSSGSKSLTLDQMMKIMLDMKNLKDWNLALKHVPQRKLRRDVEPIDPKTTFRQKRYSSDVD